MRANNGLGHTGENGRTDVEADWVVDSREVLVVAVRVLLPEVRVEELDVRQVADDLVDGLPAVHELVTGG